VYLSLYLNLVEANHGESESSCEKSSCEKNRSEGRSTESESKSRRQARARKSSSKETCRATHEAGRETCCRKACSSLGAEAYTAGRRQTRNAETRSSPKTRSRQQSRGPFVVGVAAQGNAGQAHEQRP
jgi:hypothetical protein